MKKTALPWPPEMNMQTWSTCFLLSRLFPSKRNFKTREECISVVLTLRKLRQEGHLKFEDILNYIASSCLKKTKV